MLSKPKNPKDYQEREVHEFKQAPTTPAPKPKLVVETVEIEK